MVYLGECWSDRGGCTFCEHRDGLVRREACVNDKDEHLDGIGERGIDRDRGKYRGGLKWRSAVAVVAIDLAAIHTWDGLLQSRTIGVAMVPSVD